LNFKRSDVGAVAARHVGNAGLVGGAKRTALIGGGAARVALVDGGTPGEERVSERRAAVVL
jgi:hypothetical protein